MSVFFKFRSSKEYDTVNFEGNSIPLGKLKQSILAQKKMTKSADFDLVVENAQTSEEYKHDNTMIPKNSSVIVRRVPVVSRSGGSSQHSGGNKGSGSFSKPNPLPAYNPLKIAHSNTMRASPNLTLVNKNTTSSNSTNQTNLIPSTSNTSQQQKNQQSEDDKMNAFINQTASDWLPDRPHNQEHMVSRQRYHMMPKAPPPNYVCHRCGKPGHYIQFCPTNGDPAYNRNKPKRPTGIPRDFLKPALNSQQLLSGDGSADEDNDGERSIMLLPSGALAYVQPNENAFKKAMSDDSRLRSQEDIPPSLKCPICSKIFHNAVLTPCCFQTYCDSCIISELTEKCNLQCPKCSEYIPVDKLIPNKSIRKEIEEFNRNLFLRQPSSKIDNSKSSISQQDGNAAQKSSNSSVKSTGEKEGKRKTDVPEGSDHKDQTSLVPNAQMPLLPSPPLPIPQSKRHVNTVDKSKRQNQNEPQAKPIPTISDYMQPSNPSSILPLDSNQQQQPQSSHYVPSSKQGLLPGPPAGAFVPTFHSNQNSGSNYIVLTTATVSEDGDNNNNNDNNLGDKMSSNGGNNHHHHGNREHNAKEIKNDKVKQKESEESKPSSKNDAKRKSSDDTRRREYKRDRDHERKESKPRRRSPANSSSVSSHKRRRRTASRSPTSHHSRRSPSPRRSRTRRRSHSRHRTRSRSRSRDRSRRRYHH